LAGAFRGGLRRPGAGRAGADRAGRLSAERIVEALAAAVEAARRSLGLAAYDGQIKAALVMLDCRLAEMATGEGKTLSAALAAAVGALAGMPVHVLTANDYLVERDAGKLAPMYACLGLRVGFVIGLHRGGPPGSLRSADLLRDRPRAGLRLPARRPAAGLRAGRSAAPRRGAP
jgi:hypothetical protein